MELYEYIDLSNFISYFNKIEHIAKKNNQFSFQILLDDFDKNVKYNNNLLMFKKYINENLKKMEIYYEKNCFLMVEELNNECLNDFYKLIEKEINRLTYNKNFKYYLSIKKDLYEKLTIISNSFRKLQRSDIGKKQIEILNNFITNIMNVYNIKTNILKKYNYVDKELTPYNDLLFANMKNTKDINNVLFQINEHNKAYYNVILPYKIIIKEIDKNKIIYFYKKDNDCVVFSKIFLDIFDIITKNNKNKFLIIFLEIKEKLIKIYLSFIIIYFNYILHNITKTNFNTFNLVIFFIKKGIGTYFSILESYHIGI